MRPAQSFPAAAGCDLDLTQFEDEQLVVLAKECGYSPARDELLHRYREPSNRRVRRLAAQAGLQEADRQDLEQEAVLWVLEAVRRYRTEEYVRQGGCRFRSFLHRVLHARFIDSLRQCRRRTRSILLQTQRDEAAPGESPEQQAEGREIRSRLDREVERLGPPTRALWGLLIEGVPLRNIADTLHVSYDAVKRQRRKLFAELQTSLGGYFQP